MQKVLGAGLWIGWDWEDFVYVIHQETIQTSATTDLHTCSIIKQYNLSN